MILLFLWQTQKLKASLFWVSLPARFSVKFVMLPAQSIVLANWFACAPACSSAIAPVSLTSQGCLQTMLMKPRPNTLSLLTHIVFWSSICSWHLMQPMVMLTRSWVHPCMVRKNIRTYGRFACLCLRYNKAKVQLRGFSVLMRICSWKIWSTDHRMVYDHIFFQKIKLESYERPLDLIRSCSKAYSRYAESLKSCAALKKEEEVSRERKLAMEGIAEVK